MEVPFPRAASRRLINFLIFQISIYSQSLGIAAVYSSFLDGNAGQQGKEGQIRGQKYFQVFLPF